MSSLRSLNLTHNAITEVDMGGWEYCKKLTHLELTYNNLQAITKSTFAKAESLRFLYLGHNLVSHIEEEAFKQLNQLKELYLDHNALSWTMEDTNGPFFGLSSLIRLTLSDNFIKSLTSRAFAGLGRLQSLDLSRNPITTISKGHFCTAAQKADYAPAGQQQSSVRLQSVVVACVDRAQKFPEECQYDFPKPQILLQSPENQVALKGQNITLVCKAATASSSRLEFQWRKEQKFLSDVETEVSEQMEANDVVVFTSYLHLRNIQNKDEGRYQCVIRNQFGSVYSNQSNISVYVLPSFVKTPSNLTVRAGGTARLECGATGQPKPTVSWQKDGGDDFPAARERRMHVMPTDVVFFVVGLKAADSGVYTCTARSRAGVVRANATLTVLEAPAFVRPMRSKLVAVGDTAVLDFLVITDTRTSDSGQYACEMTNTLGIERGLSLLKVVPAKSSLGPLGPDAEGMTTGIVVIVVVVCIVGTSLVWVFIIYKTRKRQRPPCSALPEAPPLIEPLRRPPEQEPFLTTEADAGDIHVRRDMCADSGSDHSSKESGHQSCDDLGSQVDTSSQTFILGGKQNAFLRTSFQPRSAGAATGTLSEQTTLRHLTRHLIAPGRPCLPGGSPSPVHSRTASATGQARSLSESHLVPSRAATVPLARRHVRVRRGSSASSESSGASGGRGGSSDERDSGFSTFPRSVRSWSSASLHCRLQPREVVPNGGSIATVSGAGSQQSCCLTPASVSQQDVSSAAAATQQPVVTDVHLSPGRRRSRATLAIVGSKRPPQPSSPARHAPATMASVV
ncbi:hypothetical protein MRX96_046211 [Rhipicephalus microplus]